MFKLEPLREVLKYEKQARDLGVSEVARSRTGFLGRYKNNELDDYWMNKRENFIKRHLVQYKKNPTTRRRLALMMWAFRV